MSPTDSGPSSRTRPHTITPSPTPASTSRQRWNWRTLESSCESAGLVSTKSKVPWWMSLSTRPMLGSIANPISPPTIVNTPITTNSSGRVQPLRSVVWSKISGQRRSSPVATATVDCTSWMKKLARYCISFSTPIRKWIHASRKPLIRPPPCSAPPPARHISATPIAPMPIHTTWHQRPRSARRS